MNRRNLILGTLLAGLLALPLLAAAQGSSSSSSSDASKAAPSAASDQSAASATSQPTASHAKSSSHSSSHHSSSSKVDLNTATKEQLAKVPGLTEETADKIIAARPFKGKNELVSKKIVTEAEYKTISAHVIAKQPSVASK